MASCIKIKSETLDKLKFICSKRKERGDFCRFQPDVVESLINREYKKEVRHAIKDDTE
jgi:hypothetical protein